MIALSRLVPIAAAALAEFSVVAQEPLHGRWDLIQRGTMIAVTIEDGWLVMIAPLTCAGEPRELLGKNAALPGHVKFALSPEGGLQLRAEIPLDEDAGPLIRKARDGFDAALAALAGEKCVPIANETPRPVSQDDLKRLCDDAGWIATPRGDDACVVELECPGAFHQATLVANGGGVRASVPLAKCDESAADSVAATGHFLLTAAGVVRMARPILEFSEGRVIPAFEVSFSAMPAAAHLAHALSALSVACQLCGEEAKALHDTNVAGEFLALSKTKPRKEKTK